MTKHSDHIMAFSDAIEEGRLTEDETSPNFAGDYMYMGTDDNGHHMFKHIVTREYLA